MTPRGVESWTDRLGRVVHYFRPTKTSKRVRLPGLPYSAEFMRAYEAAKRGEPVELDQGPASGGTGSLNAALKAYFASTHFTDDLSPGTQENRHCLLQRFAREGTAPVRGERPVAAITGKSLNKILDEYKSRNIAVNMKIALRHFFEFCVVRNYVAENPVVGLTVRKAIKPKGDAGSGWYAWGNADEEKYSEKYPLGTKPRLVLGIGAYLGLRRSDLAMIGPDHIKVVNGVERVQYRAMKTRRSSGFVLDCVLLPGLKEILDASGPHISGRPFIRQDNGEPYSPKTLTVYMREWCDAVGLDEANNHGMRKLCIARLADAGCDILTISAISGHRDLKALQIYLETRNKSRAADKATKKMQAELVRIDHERAKRKKAA